eukprot:snap_masked-scaffold425_size175135-processed-gene-0.10 protein:Tk05827 transcript:snap_masked-scaffold425_size175135-processed-gene-0.10-mRNA-1 annotation:"sid1 transmembrane family member 1"
MSTPRNQTTKHISYKFGSQERERQVTIVSAQVGELYEAEATTDSEIHYVYQLDLGQFPPRSVRIRTEVMNNIKSEHPLRVTIRSNRGTLNWNVPMMAANVKYNYMERTLCLLDDVVANPRSQEVTVVISTSSYNNIDYKLRLFEIEDFTTDVNQVSIINEVGATTPVYKFINLKPYESNALLRVKVTSEDKDVCAIVSVQPFLCPILDQETTVRFRGSYQTMLEMSSFFIDRDDYEEGLFIVFLIPESEDLCGEPAPFPSQRVKSFSYTITNPISQVTILWEVVVSLLILIIICVLTTVGTCYYSAYRGDVIINELHNKLQQSGSDGRNALQDVAMVDITRGTYRYTGGEELNSESLQESVPVPEHEEPGQSSPEDHFDTHEGAITMKTSKLPKYVTELATNLQDRDQLRLFRSMFHRSDLYLWLVLMMGIFYGIPAIQLVLSYQNQLLTSGNQDICYYNFLCSVPLGAVKDFNHIYSNIWYMTFGLLFVIFTNYRKRVHLRFVESVAKSDNGENSKQYGIPQHHGILYAMGFAMMFEGILSACYHVCPTNENFQFDTTFMYVIAVLSFMKIYQFRHPDVASNAYKVFFGLGLVMFFEVMGIFYESTLFWILSLVAYLGLSLVLTSILYHSGTWAFDILVLKKIGLALITLVRTRKMHEYSRKRLVLVTVLNLLNVVFIVYGAVFQPGISTFLLAIFICNLLTYAIYYILMKVLHKEEITWSAKIYTLIGLACWIPAAYFFVSVKANSEVSPAESRNLNGECLIFDLYDNHDIWHMFSAAGLFFVFMMLMSLDDGLLFTPRETIHVF